MVDIDNNLHVDFEDNICVNCNKIITKTVYYSDLLALCEDCYFCEDEVD